MKFFLWVIGLFILPGAAFACWNGFLLVAGADGIWPPLSIGFVVGLALYGLLSRIPVLDVFHHEAAHGIMSLLFFRRITRFMVSRGGGYVEYTGGGALGNELIGLAPYFFPVVTLAVAFARPALGAGWFPWYDVLIGLSLASHSWSVIANTKGNWHKRRVSPGVAGIRMMSDIGRSGYIFAGIMILSLTLLFFGAIFYVLAAGYRGMATCMYEIVTQSVGVYSPLLHWVGRAAREQIVPRIIHFFGPS
jgi:hypothetical protein